MFFNYLLLALRNLRKQRGYTIVNTLGLAIVSSIAIIFTITLLTVGYESLKASLTNPVKALEHDS